MSCSHSGGRTIAGGLPGYRSAEERSPHQGRARRPVVDAFDADVLIDAAVPGHPLGEHVAALFRSAVGYGGPVRPAAPGSLSRPLRGGAVARSAFAALLARLDLRPVDRATAELATALSSRYRLKAADATHLATAVGMGADRFITNNKRDFPPTITEIQVTYPADLPAPADGDTSTVQGMLAELVRRGGHRGPGSRGCTSGDGLRPGRPRAPGRRPASGVPGLGRPGQGLHQGKVHRIPGLQDGLVQSGER